MSLPPLNVVIGANTDGLERGLNRSRVSLAGLAKAGAAAGAAVGAALIAMTRASMRNLDAMTKQARSIGLTTQALQTMTLVANEAGVEMGSLTQSLGLMQRQIVELERGSATATRAFKAIGVSISDLQGLKPDEQFRRIAEAISQIEDPATQTTAAMEIFGRSGRQIINMLDDYGAKADDAAEFQRRFGIAVSQVDAEAIERANDAMGRLREAVGGIGNLLAARFAPAMERAANAVLGLAGRVADKLNPATDDLATSVIEANRHFPTMESGLNRIGGAGDEAARGMTAAAAAAKDLVDEIERARELGLADALGLAGQAGRTPAQLPGVFGLPDRGEGGVDRDGIESFLTNPDAGTVLIPAPSPLAPTRSPRPQSAPPLLGEPPIAPGVGGAGSVTDQMGERLEALRNALATEAELVAEWYETGLQTLNDALSEERISAEQYHEMRERLEREHQDRLNGIRREGNMAGLEATKSVFGSLMQIAQSGGDRLIGLQKGISAALAAINVYEGITKALTLKFPANLVAAAQVAAQGFAAISQMQSVSRGSTGSGAATAGGGAASAGATQQFNISFQGEAIRTDVARSGLRELFGMIEEGQRQGFQIRGSVA